MYNYTIVEFPKEDNDVEAVPSTWLIGETEVLWPAYKSMRFRKAVENLEKPQTSWSKFPVNILGHAVTYERAMQKAREAEEKSDIQTAEEQEEDEADETKKRMSKRKITAPSRYELDESDNDEPPAKKACPSNNQARQIPTEQLPKPPPKQFSGPSCSVRIQPQSPLSSALILNEQSAESSARCQRQPAVAPPRSPTTSTSRPTPSLSLLDKSPAVDQPLSPRCQLPSAVATSRSPTPSSSRATLSLPDEHSTPRHTSVLLSPATSSASGRDARLFTVLEKLSATVDKVHHKVNRIMVRLDALEKVEEEASIPEDVILPMTNMEDVAGLEAFLQDPHNVNCLVRKLSLVGGSSLQDTVSNGKQ